MRRKFIVELEVIADSEVHPDEVAAAINAALDEPPCSWGTWVVGAAWATIVKEEEAL